MVAKQLLSQTNTAAPSPTGTGPIVSFPGSDTIRVFNILPGNNAPLSGTLEIRGSNKPAPGANDFTNIATIDFSNRTGGAFSLELLTSFSNIQARVTSITNGSVAVFGDSKSGALSGGTGTTLSQASTVVNTQLKSTVTGTKVHLAAPVVPSITSDDVNYALNFNLTLTDVVSSNKDFVDSITDSGVSATDIVNTINNAGTSSSATSADLDLLAGAASGTGTFSGGSLSSQEIAFLDGVTANIQTQLNAKRNTSDTIGVSEIAGSGITTTELNFLSGSSSNIQSQLNSLSTGKLSLSGGTMSGEIGIVNGTAASPSVQFASDTDTGIFWPAANTLGISANGARVGSFSPSLLVVGSNTNMGEPSIRHTGFGAANPQYSFVQDTDTGVAWTAADTVSLAAAGESMVEADGANSSITIGGSTASNNAVSFSGVLAGEKVLGRVTINAGALDAVGDSSIYTVPVGRSTIVTKIYVILQTVAQGGAGGNTSLFRMNIGFGASADELVDNTSNSTIFNPSYGFNTAQQIMPLGVGDNTFPSISGSSGADYQVISAGATVIARTTVLADFDIFNFEVVVFGHEF